MFLFKKRYNLVESGMFSGMVDTHSHLMWGVDDGSKSQEQTEQLIVLMKQMGYSAAFITPHVMANLVQNTFEALTEKFEKEVLPVADSMNFELRLSAEYMLDETFISKLKTEKLLSFDGKHILVESSTMAPPNNIEEFVFEILSNGYTPILAHPERYSFWSNEQLGRFADMGCRFQLNILSLSDCYGKQVRARAEKMLDAGFYDFVGSDIHSVRMAKMVAQIEVQKNRLGKIDRLKSNNNTLLRPIAY